MRREEVGGPKPLVLPSGEVIAPREVYPLLESPDADVWNDATLTPAINSRGWTHAVTYSRAASMPTGWEMTSPLGGPISLLRRVDVGQSFGFNERWRENATLGSERQCNPTYGGSILKPDAIGHHIIMPSPPLHQRIYQNGETLVMEGAVVPLDFDSAGLEYATNGGHKGRGGGGDFYTPAIHWAMRQFQRWEFNVGGKANVHRVQSASYCPIGFERANSSGNPNLQYIGGITNSIHLQDWFATGAWFWSPETRDAWQLHLTGDANQWDLNDRVVFRHFATGDPRSEDGAGGLITYPGQNRLGRKGYLAAVVFSVPLQLLVGVVIRVYADTAAARRPHEMLLHQLRDAAHPAPGRDVSSGQIIQWGSTQIQDRAPGWLGLEAYIVCSHDIVEWEGMVDELVRNGALDRGFPWGSVPPHVMAGTERPDR